MGQDLFAHSHAGSQQLLPTHRTFEFDLAVREKVEISDSNSPFTCSFEDTSFAVDLNNSLFGGM